MKRATAFLSALALCAVLACKPSGQQEQTQSGAGGAATPAAGTTRNIEPVAGQPGAGQPAVTPAAPAQGTAAAAEVILPAPDPAKGLTIRYAVVLDGGDGQARAPENLTFATGTRFRLLLTPSDDLYVYVIHQGTDGSYILLQPIPGGATSVDRFAAGATQRLPLTGWFQFDAQAGTENLYVVASANKIERMEQLLEQAQPQSPDIGQALTGLQQRVEAGYTVTKNVGAQYGEITAAGERAKSAVIIGQIAMRHK